MVTLQCSLSDALWALVAWFSAKESELLRADRQIPSFHYVIEYILTRLTKTKTTWKYVEIVTYCSCLCQFNYSDDLSVQSSNLLSNCPDSEFFYDQRTSDMTIWTGRECHKCDLEYEQKWFHSKLILSLAEETILQRERVKRFRCHSFGWKTKKNISLQVRIWNIPAYLYVLAGAVW